ncbi:MAG: sulfatase-like hydrolase/transferase [Kiritimatiellaeota bacterium]|nr:sulfatase-like hydrolase/transferase [Kiritimatiellota bacterium]
MKKAQRDVSHVISSPRTSSRKNVVFICLDQLGAQAIGPYGNRLTKTPNMDRLAARGVVFDNFWCVSPLRGPGPVFNVYGPYAIPEPAGQCRRFLSAFSVS